MTRTKFSFGEGLTDFLTQLRHPSVLRQTFTPGLGFFMPHKAIFTSLRPDWRTPKGLFDELNSEFKFDIDVAASSGNALCEKYYTEKDNGLIQPWEGKVWCNPPYGRGVGVWVKKAYESPCLSVLLLPSRTCTSWFHDYCLKADEIRFIRGRLKFDDGEGRATFPSMVVIFRGKSGHNR